MVVMLLKLFMCKMMVAQTKLGTGDIDGFERHQKSGLIQYDHRSLVRERKKIL